MQGYIQVYTGNGKGKTTAALGLALRAAGAGLKVYIGQFIKGRHYSELESLKYLSPYITIKQYGKGFIYNNKPGQEDRIAAQKGLQEARNIIQSETYNVVILDEINVALKYELISLPDVLNLARERPKSVELVLTGRNAPAELVELADLVTEMKDIKHYALSGVKAREGIEK